MSCLHPDFTTGNVEIVPGNGGQRFRTDAAALRRTPHLLAWRQEHLALIGDLESGKGGPTVIQVDEDETTIEVLLRVTHSANVSSVLHMNVDMDVVERAALAAEKYAMPVVLDAIDTVYCSPLRTTSTALHRYALATRFGWERTAVEAAWDCLDLDITFQEPLPVSMGTRHLVRLLAFRRSRFDAFEKALTDPNGIFAAENAGTCPRYCEAHGTGDLRWTILKLSMLLQMWHRPSGSSLFCDTGAVEGIQKAVCAGCAGTWAIYDWVSLRERIEAVLEDLPNTLP